MVKDKRYFARPHDVQGREPCRGADLREYRDPRGSRGVVPKLRVVAAICIESALFRSFPGESVKHEFGRW